MGNRQSSEPEAKGEQKCIHSNDIQLLTKVVDDEQNKNNQNDVRNDKKGIVENKIVLQKKFERIDSMYDSDDWEALSEDSSKRRNMGAVVPTMLRLLSSSSSRKNRLRKDISMCYTNTNDQSSSPPPDIIFAGGDDSGAGGSVGGGDGSNATEGDDASINSLDNKDTTTTSLSPQLSNENDTDSFDSSKIIQSDRDNMVKIKSNLLYSIDEEKPVDETDTVSSSTSKQLRPKLDFFMRFIFLCVFCIFSLHSLKHAGVVEPDFDIKFNDVLQARIKSALEEMSATAAQYSASNGLSYLLSQDIRPGYQLAQHGATAHYPIVMIPGFVTSGIEVWGGKQCAKPYFRQRFWTALTSATTFLTDTNCWNEHMKLDPYTGGDPDPQIRLRASEGFAAADYFVGNYWVWSKLIENLADVGYTNNNMIMEPYDWRLPFHMLEERDGYFTKLKSRIEVLKRINNNRKVVVTAHSMGALVLHYFFAWVSDDDKNWVNENVHSYIDIAGCLLGVPKATAALLSGEMKDTAVILGPMGTVVEQFFGRKLRRDLWSTWGSLWAMLPKGGSDIWGQGNDICPLTQSNSSNKDDRNDLFCPIPEGKDDALSPLIALTNGGTTDGTIGIDNATQSGTNLNTTLQNLVRLDTFTVEEIIHFLQAYGSGLGPDTIGAQLSFNDNDRRRRHRSKQMKPNRDIWHDPTRTPLPNAPNLKIFCMYGTGLPTERAFQYKINWKSGDGESILPTKVVRSKDESISDPPLILDSAYSDDMRNITNGIRYSDGDGSVPLLSLGYLCADAWRRKDSGLNPAGIKIITREHQHERTFVVDDPIRGGPKSADHVDILGNIDMTTDFIKIVTNYNSTDVMADRFVSNIQTISKKINQKGGIYHRKGVKRIQRILATRLFIRSTIRHEEL